MTRPLMTVGRYLRLRREAAGYGIDELPVPGIAMIAIENDARAPTDIELWALGCAFDFDISVLVAIGRGVIPPVCRECGCSEFDACVECHGTSEFTCAWVEHDLCSACAERERPFSEGLAA